MARGKACPECGSRRNHVVGLWVTPEAIEVRRRHCHTCDHRWYGGQPPEEVLPAGVLFFSDGKIKGQVLLRNEELRARYSYGS